MNIRTLIVEDNKFAADFFRDMIEKQADFSLCAVLRDAEQAPEYCRVNRVDLVLMDVQTLAIPDSLPPGRSSVRSRISKSLLLPRLWMPRCWKKPAPSAWTVCGIRSTVSRRSWM